MDFTDAITQNTVRAIRFERPEHIPVVFWINPACWHHYPNDALRELVAEHPLLFSESRHEDRRPRGMGFQPMLHRQDADATKPHGQDARATLHTRSEPLAPPVLAPWEQAGRPYVDSWGCTWETTDDGITGAVVRHPLADWEALDRFTPPDPGRSNGMAPIDWCEIEQKIASVRQSPERDMPGTGERREVLSGRSEGDRCASLAMTCDGGSRHPGMLPVGSLEHGHTFLRLSYLRGYERLLYDMADGDPRLGRLIEMVEAFSLEIVQRYVERGVAMMRYPEDLGMQRGPMLAPEQFRRYIKPVYERLMAPARAAGCLVHMHSDGDIRALMDDLVVSGADVLNLQDLVNGIDWIAARLKGRVCIDLDIDRQSVTRFGSPAQIDRLIREEVEKLGSPAGGLMMIYGLYPGVPLENVKALMDALERYATFYA